MKMKVAIIGGGISGLTCAWLLKDIHDVVLLEKADGIGGHTATIDVEHKGRRYAIDTGFIVYNERTYPNFIKLLETLGVETQPTNMSFSVSCRKTGLEYGGSKSFSSLFAQKRNVVNFDFLRLMYDIVKFNKNITQDLLNDQLDPALTVGEYLSSRRFGKLLASHYLIPMGSAIWSSTLQEMLDFPLVFFARFFHNHGLLNINDRPRWRVIKGGSKQYLGPMVKKLGSSVECGVNIQRVRREDKRVVIVMSDGSERIFDHVVFACHSDEALKLLEQPFEAERRILSAIPYRKNSVVLHTDENLLPKSRRAWSAWNYRLDNPGGLGASGVTSKADDFEISSKPATLSYNMNILQGISAEDTFIVTLNGLDKIDPNKILGEFNYSHPIFTLEGIDAQEDWKKINGANNTWFCGAYWSNGFHEDGCASGIRVAKHLGASW